MSLRFTTDYRLLQHLVAFAIAWLLASVAFLYILRPITIPLPTLGYYIPTLGKGETAVQNLLYLASSLRSDKTIVVLGSSELDSNYSHRFIPYNFFPAHHVAPLIAFGKAGFDTLGMYGLLYALKPHLSSNSRLVIMLSPEWFKSANLQVKSFSDNFNDNVLLQLYWDDDPRNVFHDYLINHQYEFSHLTSTQEMYLDDADSLLNWNLPVFITKTINARAYSTGIRLSSWLTELSAPLALSEPMYINPNTLPWDTFEKQARAFEYRQMTNNDFWVRNRYYNTYLKDKPFQFKEYFTTAMRPEPEMEAFKLLLQLLHQSKVKALFVMQPMNPRMYSDLHRFDDVDLRVGILCKEFGMEYFDMYETPPEKGVLRDGMHLGELGWEQVDRAISEYYVR